MNRRLIGALLIATFVSLTLAFSMALAQTDLPVQLGTRAWLAEAGQAVDLRVRISCPAGYDVLEAFAYVVQNENQSNFGAIPLTCDGKSHRYAVRVTVFPDSPLFQRGPATASAYVLVLDPASGGTLTGQDSQRIKIR